MSPRAEFTKSTKLAAWERCAGICECGCGQKIMTPEYDHHPIPAAIGGPATLDNCRVLNKRCHRILTAERDQPAIAKTKRIFEKRIGARDKRRGFRKPPRGYNAWTRSIET